MSHAGTSRQASNVALVHGAWVDGSGWEAVYRALSRAGYTVKVVQNTTESVDGDVAATKRVIASLDDPVILVGHSYGGVVITEAGNDPRVVALVYVAGWVPDTGESVGTLLGRQWRGARPDVPAPPILPPADGFLLLDRTRFHEAFAGDVGADKAAFMADAQVPWGVAAVNGSVTDPAWKSKPSWYLVTTQDRMIPAEWQREMARRAGATVTEVDASHAAFLSHPESVVSLVEAAAQAATTAAPR